MKKLFTLILIISGFSSFAQHAHHQCGMHPVTQEQRDYIANEILTLGVPKNAGFTCIPIKPHIVRETNGTGGVTIGQIVTAISYLNEYYAPMQLEFFVCGSGPVFINNSTYYNFPQPSIPNSTEDAMATAAGPEANNTINMFFVNSIGSGNIGGYAYTPNQTVQSNRIVIDFNFMNQDRGQVLVHEVGHWLSLLHTFEGTEVGPNDPNAERVTRFAPEANCTTNGDELCDTDADPGFNGSNVNVGNCTYTGTATDNLGALYTPDITNVMSYFPAQCMNPFTLTQGQYDRSAQGLAYRQNPPPVFPGLPPAYNMNCPPQNLPAPTNFTATLNGASVNLSWTGNGTQVGYFIERSSTSATSGFICYGGMGVGPTTTTYTDNGPLASNTTYYYRVKAANGDCNAYSNVDSVTTGIIICQPQVSAPDNCNLQGFGSAHINRFRLNQGATSLIDNASNCSSNGYQNFTSIQANLQAGSSYSAIINITSPFLFTQNASLWIDFNENGIFEVSERLYMSSTPNATHNINFTVPAGTSQGFKVLRIRTRPQPDGNGLAEDPCATYQAGETEDYTVFIQNAAQACDITSIQAPVMNQSACDPNTNTFSQGVVVTYSNAPASGQLDVNGQLFNITGSPQTVTLTNLPANGNLVNVTASFTADAGCNFTLNNAFTAPANCAIACEITNMNAGIQGLCTTPNNLYTQQITLIYSGAPATGQINVNGQLFNITSSPQSVTLINLPANGQNVNVTAFFTANTSCSLSQNNLFQAPVSCAPVCDITSITSATPGACNTADNTYSVDVTVTYVNAPATGVLNVNGQTFATTASPQTVTLTGLPANGQSVNLTAFFSANTNCTFTQNNAFTAPVACAVTCSAGDVAANLDGTTVDYCPGAQITLATNGAENIPSGEEYFWVFINQTDTFFVNAGTNYTGDLNADLVAAGGTALPFDTYLVFGIVTQDNVTDICDVTPGDFILNILESNDPACSGAVCDIAQATLGTQSSCNPATNTYTQQIILTYSNPPTAGFLFVNGELFPITGSPQTVTLSNLTADGAAVDLLAGFTDNPACNLQIPGFFTAPAACSSVATCSIDNIGIGATTNCDPVSNTYSKTFIITYTAPPATGQLTVNGQLFAITGSPQTVTLNNLAADGNPVDVGVAFTAQTNCSAFTLAAYTAPNGCSSPQPCSITGVNIGAQSNCDPIVGTYSQTLTIIYNNPPATGEISVNGVFFPITGSPQTVTLNNLPGDGSSNNINVAFTDLSICNFFLSAAFTAPVCPVAPTRPLVVIMYPEGAGTLFVGNDVITQTPFTGNYPVNQLLEIEAQVIGSNVFTRWKTNTSPLFDYEAASSFVFNIQDTLIAYFNGSVSIDDVDGVFESLLVYPTITNNVVNIEFLTSNTINVQIDLFSVDGKLIRNFLSASETQFAGVPFRRSYEIGDVSKGMYFVRILSDKSISTHKIIKTE